MNRLLLLLLLTLAPAARARPNPVIYVTNYVYITSTNYLYFNQTNWIYNTTLQLQTNYVYNTNYLSVTNNTLSTNYVFSTVTNTIPVYTYVTNNFVISNPPPDMRAWYFLTNQPLTVTNLISWGGIQSMGTNAGSVQTYSGTNLTGHLP